MRRHSMVWSLSFFSAFTWIPSGCGDDAPTGDGGASSSGGGTTVDATGSTGAPPGTTAIDGSGSEGRTTGSSGTATDATTDATTTEPTAGTTDATSSGGTTDGSGTSGTSGGGGGALEAMMSDLQIFQDCMPIVPPDPVGMSFTLTLTNTADPPLTADVVETRVLDGGGAQVATVGVSPAMLGPVLGGTSIMTGLTKDPDTLAPAAGCAVLTCNAIYTVEVVLDVAGTEVTASDAANVDCVF